MGLSGRDNIVIDVSDVNNPENKYIVKKLDYDSSVDGPLYSSFIILDLPEYKYGHYLP
jgi:hypothetical protein